MATGTEAQRVQRNEIRLSSSWGMSEDMEEVAAEWEQDCLNDRLSYAASWDQYAGTVNSLMHEYHEGALTPEQERKFFELLPGLDELRPIFERLQLRWPDIDSLQVLYNPASAASTNSKR